MLMRLMPLTIRTTTSSSNSLSTLDYVLCLNVLLKKSHNFIVKLNLLFNININSIKEKKKTSHALSTCNFYDTNTIYYILIRNYSHNNKTIKSNPILGGEMPKKKERKIKDYVIWRLGNKRKW